MKSMTGYGKGEYAGTDRVVTVELKTVNHRFFDTSFRMPKLFNSAEDKLRKHLNERINRGHIDVYVTYRNITAGEKVVVNEALATQYAEAADKLAKIIGRENDISASWLLKSDAVSIEAEDDADTAVEELFKATDIALDNLEAMRIHEGVAMHDALKVLIDQLESELVKVEANAPKVAESYRIKLNERMSEILKDVPVDQDKLLNEVAFYTDKVCIDEEITRLKAHIKHFNDVICEEVPVGRKLDFLVQELNRESNTIGSKSNDIALTESVVAMKTTIEKIREQIQNVE